MHFAFRMWPMLYCSALSVNAGRAGIGELVYYLNIEPSLFHLLLPDSAGVKRASFQDGISVVTGPVYEQ